jgi:hypothetical protein
MPVMKALGVLLFLTVGSFLAFGADIRLGIIGTDTSHVTAFTRILNDPSSPNHIPGTRVVAAYKGGSPDVKSSISRVDKFAADLQQRWNVEIVPDIPTLCEKVDGILLESVDGRVHLEQAKQVIAARKPMFIDKPLAATLEDAREIARLAKEAGVPWFTSSSLRYSDIATKLKFDDTRGAITWGPGPTEPHHYLDLSWYGIHPVELLFTLMGTGCEEVTRTFTPLEGRPSWQRARAAHRRRVWSRSLPAKRICAEHAGHAGELCASCRGDCQVFPDQESAGAERRDTRDFRFHGCRAAQQSRWRRTNKVTLISQKNRAATQKPSRD